MKITFFGTSHGAPGPDRYCQSMFVETQEGSYLVDAGAPVMECLLRGNYDLKKLKAVFITHMHSDHVDYLFGLLTLASWYCKEMDFDVYLPEQVGIDAITAYIQMGFGNADYFPNSRVRMHLIKESHVYAKEEMTVTAFHTGHMKMSGRPSYGFLMEAEGKKLYISGDLDGQTIDYPDFLNEKEVDTFVVECAHFPAQRLIEKLKNCRAKCVMPIHVWRLDKYDILRQAQKELPFSMEYPADGDCFEI